MKKRRASVIVIKDIFEAAKKYSTKPVKLQKITEISKENKENQHEEENNVASLKYTLNNRGKLPQLISLQTNTANKSIHRNWFLLF